MKAFEIIIEIVGSGKNGGDAHTQSNSACNYLSEFSC